MSSLAHPGSHNCMRSILLQWGRAWKSYEHLPSCTKWVPLSPLAESDFNENLFVHIHQPSRRFLGLSWVNHRFVFRCNWKEHSQNLESIGKHCGLHPCFASLHWLMISHSLVPRSHLKCQSRLLRLETRGDSPSITVVTDVRISHEGHQQS